MNSKYRLIVFDVDGTLLNTAEGVLSSAKYAIAQMGFQIPSAAILETFIGPPIQDSFERVFHVQGNEKDQMADMFRNRYKDVDLLKARPYNGIYDLMSSLQQAGYKIAIATYKRQDYAKRITEYFDFNKYTDVICGSDFDGKMTKADIIQMAVEKSGMTSADAIMIGDTMQDATGARNQHMNFIAVTYGFGFKPDDVLPDGFCMGVADKPGEIFKIVEEANKK